MKYIHFTVEERETIQRMLWQKASIRSIANALGRHPSSISREIKRNLPPERRLYTPRLAHEKALIKRKRRGREDRLKNNIIRDYVIKHLKDDSWSPEQIAGRLPQEIPGQNISYEAIYQYIYAQVHRNGYGELRKGCEDLRIYLKKRHKRRQKKGARRAQKLARRENIPSIEERPLEVEERIRIGDWETDTIASKDNAPGLNSLLERKSGLILLTKLSDKASQCTTEAIIKRLLGLPRHTLTLDNGPENKGWETIEKETGLSCFYAHPYSSWERGSNENGNGLVRWYFPKRTDFRKIDNEEITRVEHALNNRPRKRLGWKTPLEVFSEELKINNLIINMNTNISSVALVS